MKPIERDEVYQHLNQFLKNKGIEMKDGSYAESLQKGCGLLTDVVNLTQKGMEKAKNEIDKRLDQMRQMIHEKTAPKPAPSQAAAGSTPTQNQTLAARAAARKRRKHAKIKKGGAKPQRKI